jgi:hypothetical protein
MAKYLRIDPEHSDLTGSFRGASYTLPEDADIESIADQVSEALANGDGLTIPLERIGEAEARSYIVINGSLVRCVLIGETPERAGPRWGA